MQVQRVSRQRRSGLPLAACGCLGLLGIVGVAVVVGLVVLLPALPGIAAQIAGFAPSGSVESAFSAPPPAAPVIQEAQPVEQVTINLGDYGVQVIQNEPTLYDFTIGTAGGTNAAAVTFTEAGLLDLCRQRTTLCANQNPQIQNVALDLRPNGMVVYADATLPQLGGASQRLGAVLRVDGSGRRLTFVGLDIDGALFVNPPGELAGLVDQVEAGANDLLNTLTVQASGVPYALVRIIIDDTTATLFLQ
ncbi:MAG: hypothetical protein SF162_15560 [bacterium]|nr:hypothetical protein [bacterium]